MALERIYHCMACHREGKDVELDLTTPGTRDAPFTVTFPTHTARVIYLCGRHAKPLWDLEGLGEFRHGGTMKGRERLPYHAQT